VTASTRPAISAPNLPFKAASVYGVSSTTSCSKAAQGLIVRADLGQDRRNGNRMGDVRVSALAFLALMPVRGCLVRAADQSRVRAGARARRKAQETGEKITAASGGRRRG